MLRAIRRALLSSSLLAVPVLAQPLRIDVYRGCGIYTCQTFTVSELSRTAPEPRYRTPDPNAPGASDYLQGVNVQFSHQLEVLPAAFAAGLDGVSSLRWSRVYFEGHGYLAESRYRYDVSFAGVLPGGTIDIGAFTLLLSSLNGAPAVPSVEPTGVFYYRDLPGGGREIGPNELYGAARVSTTAPEPGTWALLGTGLLAVGGIAARRRRSTA